MTLLLFIVGLTFLILGAELLVRGASKIATALGISPLVIGLTVVALGTSSPELAISINGALSGQADIALGNVIGSNIFNILFILGLSALIVPLYVSQQLIRFDVPLMIGLSVAVLFICLDQMLTRFDGLLLVACLIIYIVILVVLSLRNRSKENGADLKPQEKSTFQDEENWIINIVFVVIGLALLVLGSRWFVMSVITFANYFGISELIIGLTIVAAGTSMPEVVTSVIAAIRGERDIAVGNVVGSNIFNILGVLGVSTILAPSGIPVSEAVIGFDIPIMIVVAISCLPIFFTGGTINRWEGALFLSYYISYTLYLVFNATQHDLLPIFNYIMLYFIIPLSVVTIIVVVFQEMYVKSKTPPNQVN
ncbi:calcium/sodium antiporter [Fodinibius salsisoli]|uniref:Calcium/sodium antiporter n=1 Tax=Fodinibius salsisoli TaxID=2820877 RepID=A0ABT3PSX5_9BACT|nr:calcium/sodium antiporter [Fodinibius salsisoli]MCW9708965.1 calcium/sodium antiporter [Fodinibius salsisoli]